MWFRQNRAYLMATIPKIIYFSIWIMDSNVEWFWCNAKLNWIGKCSNKHVNGPMIFGRVEYSLLFGGGEEMLSINELVNHYVKQIGNAFSGITSGMIFYKCSVRKIEKQFLYINIQTHLASHSVHSLVLAFWIYVAIGKMLN